MVAELSLDSLKTAAYHVVIQLWRRFRASLKTAIKIETTSTRASHGQQPF
jgi:hypothetical protein